jgi:uncharacterized protein (DUF2126 family)
MGFRLPLDSLPWVAEGDIEPKSMRDPFDEPRPLPARFSFPPRAPEQRAAEFRGQHPGPARDNGGAVKRGPFDAPALHESASGVVRTALCVEPRGGTLRIFMPPLYTLEAYAELVAAIEATTAELGCKVQLEGYTPPQDSRIGRFSISRIPA